MDLSRCTDKEQHALNHIEKTHSRNAEGRYIVRLPTKAVSLSLVVKLVGDSTKTSSHSNEKGNMRVTQGPTELGHPELVPVNVLNNAESSVYYLSSHGVVMLFSTTTKLRVVQQSAPGNLLPMTFCSPAQTSTPCSLM